MTKTQFYIIHILNISNFTGFFLQTADAFNKQFSPPDFFLSLSKLLSDLKCSVLTPKWCDGILECTPGMAGDSLPRMWYKRMQGLELLPKDEKRTFIKAILLLNFLCDDLQVS